MALETSKSPTELTSVQVPVVAIGASAGGLEAFSELLTNLPSTTGFAYIYIHHDDGGTTDGSTREGTISSSDALSFLARATQMPVAAVEEKLPVLANHVYVYQAGPRTVVSDQRAWKESEFGINQKEQDPEVIDGLLTFLPRRQSSPSSSNQPIDRFFMSLAYRQRSGAIGILLSGGVSDGTLGMRAIRSAGGLTFAQDETARFRSTPQSAISEGMVDQVLSPAQIAQELDLLSRQREAFQQAAGADAPEHAQLATVEDDDSSQLSDLMRAIDQDNTDLIQDVALSESLEIGSEDDLGRIIQMVRKATGTDFKHYKMTTIRRRIIRRMLLFKLDTLNDYAHYLHLNPDEIRSLYDDLLINVTTFFRDTDTMDYLQKVLLPQMVQNKPPSESLRIWVPACSTGQEAYSIAMLLLEVLGDRASSLAIQLFATDLSEPAVAKARLGSYTRGEIMDVSPWRLSRFFTKVDDHYRINKAVRDLCVFAPHNLLKDPPFSRLDFVSCRNLLIYLDTQLQRKAIATFHYALNPNGFLLLGKSETVGSSPSFFSPVETNYKLYARKNDIVGRALFEINARSGLTQPRSPGIGSGSADVSKHTDTTGEPPRFDEVTRPRLVFGSRTPRSVRPTNDLDKAVDSLLGQYVPASVVVNADLDIIQFRGSTGLYLEPSPGRASLNLLKMARPALTFELRNIIHKAGLSNQPVRRSGLEVKVNDRLHYVAIEAVPFTTNADEGLFLILFEEVTAIVATDSNSTDAQSRRIRQLEEELATLREDMRSVIDEQEAAHEELQSANEEVISSNEELQSINEELETSKEEIESTNEELLTINQELQIRNDQLSEANAFAEAIFGTIREATLILTPDLRVKSANSVFYSLFGLNEVDTEARLIYELANRQWDIPQLRSLLTDVATRDVQVEGFELTYEFPGIGEKVLSLNARRVMRQQGAILLAIEDITEHRRSQRLIEEREAWFHQIADNAPTLIWVAGTEGRYSFLNRVWLEYTGLSQTDVVASEWAQLIHPDDRAAYEQTYQTNLLQQHPFKIEYRLRRQDGVYRWMLENAEPTFTSDGQFSGFIGTAADVNGQKELNSELDRLVAERTSELTQTNDRLQQSKDQLQSVLNGVPAFITLMEAILPPNTSPADDPIDFRTVTFNRQARELIGENIDAERNGSLVEIMPFVRENGLLDAYIDVYKSGKSAYREVGLAVHGEDRCFVFYITRQIDQRGVVVTALDITDRKQAEEAVRKTAEALQVVLDSSPASIGLLKVIRSTEGLIVDFRVAAGNQRFAELVGQPVEQLLLLQVEQLARVLWNEMTLPNLKHVVETGEPFYIEQTHPKFGWIALSVMKQDDGVVLTGLDITDLRQMQQQQENLLAQAKVSEETVMQLTALQQQVRARGELLRASSHDLRGSLGIIQGAADMLSYTDSDEERAQMLSMIQRNVQETTRLVTELLDFSRLEAGQHQVIFASFNAAELLKKLGENVRPLVEGKGLHLDLVGQAHLLINSDALNVLRIAQNLVLNALKYTQQGSITVRWGSIGQDEWFFSVEDTRPGMDQVLADKLSLVPKLTTGSGASTTAVPDTLLGDEVVLNSAHGEGIGLVIVRQLCSLLQGRLLVESQPNVGSTFRVLLPQRY
ncbi:CheR family methyltransferase [Spirosoma utsteinense]|uniref:CheR family methyltransferase n=1 Tax=Spirosoma utsteinense TaxID=2585773 RepID=UPI00164677E2|nr:CheR family methyltransferase [Spirosoma utsteinense]MBC3785256.1 two-component system CheB/CheR fusion protein [Spirosoma utsteinense]